MDQIYASLGASLLVIGADAVRLATQVSTPAVGVGKKLFTGRKPRSPQVRQTAKSVDHVEGGRKLGLQFTSMNRPCLLFYSGGIQVGQNLKSRREANELRTLMVFVGTIG